MMSSIQSIGGVPNSSKRNLCYFLVLMTAQIWESTEYNLGNNETLNFYYELHGQDTRYLCNGIIRNSTVPFIINEQIMPLGLKQGQEGRFQVEHYRDQRDLNISITIQGLQPIDEGMYVVGIIETVGQREVPQEHKQYLDVTYPVGKAECHVLDEIHSEVLFRNWHAVSCNGTVDDDGNGYLLCHQDSKVLPYRQLVRRHGYVMTAIYWIVDPTSEVKCCSMSHEFHIDLGSCDDFVYEPYPDPDELDNHHDGVTTSPTTNTAPSKTDCVTSERKLVGYICAIVGLAASNIVTLIALVSSWRSRGWRSERADAAGNKQDENSNADLLGEPGLSCKRSPGPKSPKRCPPEIDDIAWGRADADNEQE